MRKRKASDKSWSNRWARKIGKLAALPEISVMEAKNEWGARMRDLRVWKMRVLKRLAKQQKASRRALKEFKVGLERAGAALNTGYQGAMGQFRF
jgi:hypothetical protein